ncbi:MAG: guanylate kinase [Lachnospiraceae bacterium]|nr:guanylate kinase [Lachnospiraceae bacterium]
MAEHKGIIVVVSGFSGTGKGALMKRLITQYNNNYILSVSMTTRKPREGEVDGREYFFTTDEVFEQMVADGKFIEHAGYCGHYYGTPRDFVDSKLNEGKDVLLEIEVQGALQVREIYPDAVLLFVTAPSVEELKNRLIKRGTESRKVIRERLERAKEEAKYIDSYNYLLVNDDLNQCTKLMHEIIQAAHTSPKRNREFIDEIVRSLDQV